jgi:cytochrome b6-f complex iron-sulfur subunit
MKNHLPTSQCKTRASAQENESASERRRFLKSAAGVAGGLALGLQLAARADETATGVTAAVAPETLVPIPEKVLAEVGGAGVVETANDKVIVARTGASEVVACSAVCTHRGGIVNYVNGEFVCPRHGARFGLDGKVKQGPAQRPLKPYTARLALGLSPKSEA